MMSFQLDKCYFGTLTEVIKYKDKESDCSIEEGPQLRWYGYFVNHSM